MKGFDEGAPLNQPAPDFLRWFFARDLWEAIAWPISGAVIFAVALTTLGSCMALALPRGAEQVRIKRLGRNPLARSVRISVPIGERGFDEPRLKELHKVVAPLLKVPTEELRVVPFHRTDLQFFEFGAEGIRPTKGRTVFPEDPLLNDMTDVIRKGVGFKAEGPGLILAPSLVRRLGGSPDQPPEKVVIREPATNMRMAWPVVGVTRDDLPQPFEFLLTRAEDQKLQAQDSTNTQKCIWSGPIATGWPQNWSDYPKGLRQRLSDEGIEVDVKEKGLSDVRHLLLGENRNGFTESKWREFLNQIAVNMELELAVNAHPEFVVVEACDKPRQPRPKPRVELPMDAVVYVGDFDNIGPAADAARDQALNVDDAARAVVEEIRAMAHQAETVAFWLVITFCTSGAISLGLALYLRGRQKGPQYGMLRALGADARLLRNMATVEATMLWVRGTGLGLLFFAFVALGVGHFHGLSRSELYAAVETSYLLYWVFGFVVASYITCLAGNHWATRGVRHRPPAESLGLTS